MAAVATELQQLKQALANWQGVRLPSLQSDLERFGLEIAGNQQATLESRKQLAEQTKEFRRTLASVLEHQPPAVSEAVNGTGFQRLLKGYQQEIDLLTKRLKFSDTAFLAVYQPLMEAPDPTPLLQCCVDQFTHSASVVLENQRLRSELDRAAGMNSQLSALQEQNSAIKSRLEELELQQNPASLLNSSSSTVGYQSQPPEMLEKRYYEEREQDLLHQLSRANAQLRSQQTNFEHTINQLRNELQKASAGDASTAAAGSTGSHAAFDIVQLEREISELRSQCSTLERENKHLKLGSSIKRNSLIGDDEGIAWDDAEGSEVKFSDLRLRLREVEQDSSRARGELRDTRAALEAVKQQSESTIAALESRNTELLRDLEHWQKIGRNRSDYDEIKSELTVFKSVEFGEDSVGEPLQTLQLEKNRRLQSELTLARVALQEAESKLHLAEQQLSMILTKSEEQTKLISNLESDLYRLQQQQLQLNPSSLAMSSPSPLLSPPNTTDSTVPSPQISSLLPVLTSQRDRFHKRNLELEADNKRLLSSLSSSNNEIENLRADNVRLYEKIRFLESFAGGAGGAKHHRAINVSSDNPTEQKYSTLYEQRLDPFQQFHADESNRRIKSMSPLAQSTLFVARLVLARPMIRTVLVGYVVLLHLLVGSTLLQFSHSQECRHDHDVKFWRETLASGYIDLDELKGVKELIDNTISSSSIKGVPRAENALLK